MSFTIKNKYLLVGLIIALLGVFLFGQWSGRKKGDRASTALIRALRDTIRTERINIAGVEQTAYNMSQIVVTQKQAIQSGLLEREAMRKLHLKAVNELTKAQLTINILRDSVKHNGQIITIRDTVFKERNAILLPFNFGDTTKYVTFGGKFNEKGVMSYGLSVPVELKVYSGIEKRTYKPIVTITSSNPLVQITDIESIKMDSFKPKKWSVGIQGGYGVTKDGLSPYVGIGISRSILRF